MKNRLTILAQKNSFRLFLQLYFLETKISKLFLDFFLKPCSTAPFRLTRPSSNDNQSERLHFWSFFDQKIKYVQAIFFVDGQRKKS